MSDSDARGFTMVEKAGGSEDLPKPDFASFLISLGSTAFVHMGLLPDPESGKTRTPNLGVARQTIDMLELLEVKTRGNLTPDEATLLRNLLTDLRLRFVESSREPKRA